VCNSLPCMLIAIPISSSLICLLII
jgi:hypothetical protein